MSCGIAVITGTVGGSSKPSREVRQLDPNGLLASITISSVSFLSLSGFNNY